ncbi:MAG TPA: hypothetical protein DCY89_08875 [Gammaproteobacteria bacterium]|nr:hypothetical protein [Gammaproteobacteria bacterium]
MRNARLRIQDFRPIQRSRRHQTKLDAERAQAMLDSAGQSTVSPAMTCKFSRVARERIRLE